MGQTTSEVWNPGQAVAVTELLAGANLGKSVQCKIVQGVSNANAVPLYVPLNPKP